MTDLGDQGGVIPDSGCREGRAAGWGLRDSPGRGARGAGPELEKSRPWYPGGGPGGSGPSLGNRLRLLGLAWVAQSVEQRTRNAQVRSSNLLSGSSSEALFGLTHPSEALCPSTCPNNFRRTPKHVFPSGTRGGRAMAGSIR